MKERKIKALVQTAHFLKRPDIELLDKIQQIKDEIVKVSHQKEPNLRLHRFMLNQLKKTQKQLQEFRKAKGFE